MAVVRIDPRRDIPAGSEGTAGFLRAKASRIREDGAAVVFPDVLVFKLPAGETTECVIPDNGPDWFWRLEVGRPVGEWDAALVRDVTLSGSVDWADVVVINPETHEPLPPEDLPTAAEVLAEAGQARTDAVDAAAGAEAARVAAAGASASAAASAVGAGAAASTAATAAATAAVAPVAAVIATGRLSESELSTTIGTVSATEMGNAESALRDETVGVVTDVLGGGTAGLVRVELGTLTDLTTARPAWDGVVDWFVSHETDIPLHFADGDVVSWVEAEPEPFTPLSVPGIVAWFDAVSLDAALNNGDNVTSWPNLVLGGPAAVAGATFPHFAAAGVNGGPAVQFNGANGLLTVVLPSGYSGPSSIYLLARSLPGTTAGTDFFYDGGTAAVGQLQLGLARNATNNWVVYNGDNFTKAGAGNGVHLFKVAYDNPSSELFVDEVSLGSGTTNDGPVITKLALGGRADATTGNILDGYICALVYIQGTITPENDVALSNYLQARYGL